MHLPLVYLVIGAKNSGSISKEFNSTVGIEPEAEANNVKYLDLMSIKKRELTKS